MIEQNEMGLLGWAGLTGYSPPPPVRTVLPMQGPVLGGRAVNQEREAFR
jgi:hypothetical protein